LKILEESLKLSTVSKSIKRACACQKTLQFIDRNTPLLFQATAFVRRLQTWLRSLNMVAPRCLEKHRCFTQLTHWRRYGHQKILEGGQKIKLTLLHA
jgi:hypothetical protein